MKFDRVFELIGAVFGSVFSYLFGGFDKLILFLVTLAIIDFGMGLLKGAWGKSDKSTNGKVSSIAASEGLQKKGIMFVVLIVANICDQMFNAAGMIRTAALWFYITTEGISIVENAALLGVPFPQFLIDLLEVKNKFANDGKVEGNE